MVVCVCVCEYYGLFICKADLGRGRHGEAFVDGFVVQCQALISLAG